MNPVVFDRFQYLPSFVPLTKYLSEFQWKWRIVGMTSAGLLYVDEKVSRGNYYNYFPKLLPWKECEYITISRGIGWGGLFFGILALAFGGLVFHAGWIRQSHTGSAIYT